jgi:hypothetical protein
MDEYHAYQDAMLESLRNAQQWLEDARLIVNNGSIAHSFVLRDLAGEEIAKAYACWQVLVGAIPTNHPLVKPSKKETIETVSKRLGKEAKRDSRRVRQGKKPKKPISVFTSHAMKYALAADLSSSFFRTKEVQADSEKLEAFLGGLNAVFGEIGVMRRSEWLYVNLCESDQGLDVSSPMRKDFQVHDSKFQLKQMSLEAVKKLVAASPSEFSNWASTRRKRLKESDPYFPNNPKWLKSASSTGQKKRK